MKKRMKKLASLLLASAMVFSLAACGGGGDDADGGNDSADGKTTIKITWWGGDSRHEYTQELLDAYTAENPNVEFEATPAGWEGYFDKLSTQAASGSMPDIVQMDYLYIATYAKNGSLADLSEFIEDGTIDTANVDDATLNTGLIDGKMAGIVTGTNALAVTYNPEVLEAAGVEAPTDDWTWDDYVALNTAVSESTGEESALTATIGPFGDMNFFNYYVRQHGETLFNEDVATLGIESLPVVTGEAGTTLEWNTYPNKVVASNPNLKLALMPGANENSAMWLKPAMFWSVSESSKVKEECAKFINWMINSEEANDIIMAERGVPISSEIRDYLKSKEDVDQTMIDMFDYVDKVTEIAGECPAADPGGIAEINKAFNDAGNSVMYGQATAEEADSSFRELANEILERNNG